MNEYISAMTDVIELEIPPHAAFLDVVRTVIATTAGGLTHIVRDSESGFLLETRDSSEFAARLKMLLKDPELQAAFSETSYQTARRLSWDDTAEKVFELYECLVDAALPEACVCGK
jgi:glycosyltransferase involved in cell wall biosynthesis